MNEKYGSESVAGSHAILPMSRYDGFALEANQDRLQVKCAWCGADMGSKPAEGVTEYRVSHGICLDCVPKMLS